MTEAFIVVWRDQDGAAVQSYGYPKELAQGRSVRVFKADEAGVPETVEGEPLSPLQLEALLTAREPFLPRRVSLQAAREVLGWDV